MLIVIFTFLININKCVADLSFLKKINFGRLFSKEKSFKGSYKATVYLGSRAKIPCFQKKSPSKNFISYSWYHSGKNVSNSKHYSVSKYGELSIHRVLVEDSGDFICAVHFKSGTFRFKHDITVLQLPSRSLFVHFVYAVTHCTQENEEFAKSLIKSKVIGKVCVKKECLLSYIHSSCHSKTLGNSNLRLTVPIILPAIPRGNCKIECTRKRQQKKKEEMKRRVITAVTGDRLKTREEPREMSFLYTVTDEDTICNPGFEMKGSRSRSFCIPCSPGNFLEKGYCIPCHLNQYNGKYATTECHKCFGNRVTRSRGTVSEDDCLEADNYVLWIFLTFAVITIPFILICCCWSCFRFLGGTVLGKCIGAIMRFDWQFFQRRKDVDATQGEKLNSKKKSSMVPQKSAEFHKQRNVSKDHHEYSNVPPTYSRKTAANVVSSLAIPSMRYSTTKDLWKKPPHLQSDKMIIPPPPPTLPTDWIMNKDTSNNNEGETVASKGMDTSKENKVKPYFPSHSKSTSPRTKRDLNRQFIGRIPRNSPMYNAIQKSRV